MQDHFIETNDIKLHYIDTANDKPLLLLLHGLTANAHAFDGLLRHGLTDHYRVIAPDLRGRGLSSRPATGYSFYEHAQDILGMMDALSIERVLIGGHSYGGLLSIYLAANYPERIDRIILLDAAIEMNPNILEMLGPTLSRLDTTYPSLEDFLEKMKAAPQNTFWDKDMEAYYLADAFIRKDNTVNPHSNLTNILEVAAGTASEPWLTHFGNVQQATLLVNGVENYTLDQPVLPDFKAQETASLMTDCTYVEVGGNHHTMLYGTHALETVQAMLNFLKG